MNNNVLSIEQMKHLLDLGLKIDDASCSYSKHIPTNRSEVIWGYEEDTNDVMFETIPAFTLQDILEILPSRIVEDWGIVYILKIEQLSEDDIKEWNIGYCTVDYSEYIVNYTSTNIIETAYDILCWCIENKYI